MVSARVLGSILALTGITSGVAYAYLILYTREEISILVLKVTAALIALIVGSLIAGVGIALILGWREYEEAKRRMREKGYE
ncbi:MAG: hypothetical protein QXO93_03770 [Acidilobaceae archaeon]